MVQILAAPQNKPTFAQKLSQGLGRGLELGEQMMKEHKEKEAVKSLVGEGYENLPKEFQKIAYEAQLKRGETAEKLKANKAILSNIEEERGLTPGSLDAYAQDPSMAERVTRPSKKTQASQPIDPEQLDIIKKVRSSPEYQEADPLKKYQLMTDSGISKENAKAESDIAAAQEKPSMFETESSKLGAQRTDKYISHVETKGRAALEKQRGLEVGMALHRQGATGFKLTNTLADYFGVPSLADPASKGFNASLKSQFSGMGDIVKGKVSNFEFDTLKQRIASAEDSPKAAEVLMVCAMLENKIAIKEMELMEAARKKYYDKGKQPPPNLDLEVQEELRPYADLILAQTNKEILNILNPTRKDNPNRQTLDDIWGQ